MKQTLSPRFLIALLAVMTVVPAAFGRSNADYTQFGRDIRVAADQTTGELTCIDCSIYIRGQVAGGITTVRGNIVVEENGSVAGDVTSVIGDVRADRGAKITGAITAVGGTVHRHAQASIAGDVTTLPGTTWVYLVLVSPFLILAGIAALIVWLVQRRRPTPALARAA